MLRITAKDHFLFLTPEFRESDEYVSTSYFILQQCLNYVTLITKSGGTPSTFSGSRSVGGNR